MKTIREQIFERAHLSDIDENTLHVILNSPLVNVQMLANARSLRPEYNWSLESCQCLLFPQDFRSTVVWVEYDQPHTVSGPHIQVRHGILANMLPWEVATSMRIAPGLSTNATMALSLAHFNIIGDSPPGSGILSIVGLNEQGVLAWIQQGKEKRHRAAIFHQFSESTLEEVALMTSKPQEELATMAHSRMIPFLFSLAWLYDDKATIEREGEDLKITLV